MPLILGTNSIKDTGFNVDNSLLFEGGGNFLFRTQSSGNRRTLTISFWVKRSKIDDRQSLNSCTVDGSNETFIWFDTDNTLFVKNSASGSTDFEIRTNRLFRDVSAWYHIVVAIDTTQGTASNRVKIYINGQQESSFSSASYPSQNFDTRWNENNKKINIGREEYNAEFFNGYMCEHVMIDGQQLAPDQFGEFDDNSGIWKPIDVSGLTFGTNGFYLQFKESGTGTNASGMGADTSGNTNHFTVNFQAIYQKVDTCTNNFATMNPLDNFYASSTFSEGNTNIVTDASSKATNTSTFGINSGKWYCEIKAVQIYNGNAQFGIKGKVSTSTSDGVGEGTDGYCYTASGGNKINNGSASSFGTTWNNNDIIGIAVDLDNNKLYFSRNGTWQNSGDPTSGATGTGSAFNIGTPSSGFYFIATSDNDTSGGSANNYLFNFGNAPFTISSGNTDGNGYGNFEYAVPSGYFSLNTKNLAEYG